ncbi:hypothetical protein N7471_006712 [Penicillium samsonianum]|uniref:uncharacterized protein n=1 Tax=Penicillium samsonianum TaxID=1882272 RepID=UPI0025483E34|nr:uncharacterized protein N7471_006712 [Penicillium samsonianum]KAJ6140226.1 hypothetical protein N7471_006712 [Penicillium samsonianum]
MSRPVLLREAQQNQTSFGTSREREFYKYLPPHHLNAHTLQHVGRDTSTEYVAQSSSDPVLTAFAQLGTLRLDAQRALISLFGRHKQHVVTEATRTTSLLDNADNNDCDQLWVGSCTMSYDRSFCKSVSNPPPSAQTPSDRLVIVPDLSLDDKFKEHPDVTGGPNIRFLVCSPIISPKGIVIGSYTILDNKPHGPLGTDLVKFLTDIATTVMDYLDATRSQAQHLRGERMIVGLGSFLEGKGSLRNSWLSATDDPRSLDQDKDHTEGHINQEQQDKQVLDDVAQAMPQNCASSDLPLRPHTFHTAEHKKTYTRREQSQLLVSSKTSKGDHLNPKLANPRAFKPNMAADNMGTRQQSLKENYTTEVKEAFSRAANLIRESVEVEAVVFFDANFRSEDASVNDTKSDLESSGLESCSSSDEEMKARKTFTQHDYFTSQAEDPSKTMLNSCELLGFATSNTSSINSQLTADNKIALSESFLRDLLRRYPQGKIFNYGEDGSISSDNTSDSVFKSFTKRSGSKTYKRIRKTILRQDATTLLQLAPNARSIIFSPLWDSHKGRWYSGSLAWTRAPHRIFTSDSELSFIFTFGNSLMAEVHRLSARFAERAKSDLLAGLSHELRSPLHGIFGTAELLNDTIMDALQRGFVHTILSCAFTLLGSINQLLEYASINDVGLNSRTAKLPVGSGYISPTDGTLASAWHDSQPGKPDPDSYVELDVVLEETIESVFAGYSFVDNSRSPLRGVTGVGSKPINTQIEEVKVILDIDHSQNWKFSTRPDALRVVLTNIFGNALKFTQHGYIYISLKATLLDFGEDSNVTRSKVTVTIRDTGCGIEQEFLRNELFNAFSQEDTMTTGNGLGFNIIHRIISSLGGDIQINSQKDIGTEVLTTMTLDHISEHTAEPDTPDDPKSLDTITVTKDLTREKTIGILGLGLSELDATLSSSLQKLCRDWLGMDVCLVVPSESQFSQCEFYIAPQEFLDMGNMEIKPIAPDLKRLSSPVIIICSSPRIAHSMFVAARKRGETDVLEFISQPCGPRKLATTLEICIKRQQRRKDLTDGRVERLAGASKPTTRNEFERGSFLNVPTSDNSRQSKTKVAGISTPIYGQNSRDTPEQLNPREKVDNPQVSTAMSGFPTTETDYISQPQQSSPVTVLLVDDNDLNLRLLIAFMKKLGCDYAVAKNGQEALETFKANPSNIRVILMDISMPIMDGLESTRRIREFEKESKTKSRVTIVALTGLAQADVQRDAFRSGMDMFLTKPVRMDILVPMIMGTT